MSRARVIEASALVGGWTLVEYAVVRADGRMSHPLGADALGSIVYTADGLMTAHLARKERPPFAAEYREAGTEREKAAAFGSYFAYGGRWKLLDGQVAHRVETSTYPNWVGGEQVRDVAWDGRLLTLTMPPHAQSRSRAPARLTWRRADVSTTGDAATAARLIGGWRLVEYVLAGDDGASVSPMGEDAVGFILYSADGRMSAQLARRRRDHFKTDIAAQGTPAEKAGAIDSMLSYCGTWHIDGDAVTHQVELSLFPNWQGSVQRRAMEFKGNRLVLRAAPGIRKEGRLGARITWQREIPGL